LEPILGMFVNTLAIRNAPTGEKTFRDYVQEVKESALRAYENQDYPFEELVDKLDVARDLSRSALFDTMFVLQNTEREELYIEGLKFSPYPNKHNVSKFDLTFSAVEGKEQISFRLEYAASLFKPETAERMAGHFIRLIEAILHDPQTKLSALEMMTPQETAQIVNTFNGSTVDYPREKTIHQWFEEQAERTPEQAAVVFEDKQLTYRELNERANRLAHTLRTVGVRANQPVCIMAERSLEMLVAIVGILKAGGAYVPLDPDHPEERIRYVLEDSGAQVLLLQRHLQGRTAFEINRIVLDEEEAYSGQESNPEATAEPGDLAYAIYTSGTTGKPKGTLIEHRQVVHLIEGLRDQVYGAYDSALHVSLLSPFHFDASVKQIFASLLLGHTLFIVPRATASDGQSLSDYYRSRRIDVSDGTPAHLQLLLAAGSLQGLYLRHMLIGGEALKRKTAARLLDLLAFHGTAPVISNVYGPTETCVDATVFPIARETLNLEDGSGYVPIGKPLGNNRIYILDRHGRLQPIGLKGELFIAGDGVGRGYLNLPELTAEKFMADPFVAGERMYRTGDLARWLPDGNIEYLGRIDDQVKVRGYRIELGDVEAHLLKAPSVREAVAVAREDEAGQKYLCAYFVADKELTVSELRETLAQELPGYMVPSYFVQLTQMPLTTNGKVNRKALPAPEGSVQTGVEYVPARTPLEAQLAEIWQDVLGLRNFGVKDNFFDLGGHSLKVLQLMQRIHAELEIDIPLRVVFEKPSIEKMADELLKLRFHKIEHSGRHIVKLNENGLINVFCFPPVLGYGIAFAEMAKHLDHHCVVYSIEFIEDACARPDMLDQYVDSILSVQEKSPYVFLGYSAGGNLAFEVAKAMEKRGYSVSDIIMIDAMKKDSWIETSTEEAENHIDEVLKEIPEPYKQILTAPVTRDKVRSKTLAYHKYWNELVNTGVVQANIHGLVAASSKEDHLVQDNVLLWKEATQQKYAEHNLVGEHIEVLMSGYVEENAKVLRLILKNIGEQAGLGLVPSSGTL
ncbi:non-ribosomal peptide synthetase, partial [Paenibacillus elgii]|uniref:non-ribosomal peptide synthetase n=1 Tax=Paenibacillus elgii TaxID=189691 RepID=UPI0030DBB6A6